VLREAYVPTFQFQHIADSIFYQILAHVPIPFHCQQVENIWIVMLWLVHKPASARILPTCPMLVELNYTMTGHRLPELREKAAFLTFLVDSHSKILPCNRCNNSSETLQFVQLSGHKLKMTSTQKRYLHTVTIRIYSYIYIGMYLFLHPNELLVFTEPGRT